MLGLVAVLAVVAAVAGGASMFPRPGSSRPRSSIVHRTMSNFFCKSDAHVALDSVYKDADGDLIADAPENEALLAKPTELVFSFITSEDSTNEAAQWQELMDAIQEKIGFASYLFAAHRLPRTVRSHAVWPIAHHGTGHR